MPRPPPTHHPIVCRCRPSRGISAEPALTDALDASLGHPWSARLEYLPVGYGSHHWQAAAADGSRWFVTADALGAGALTAAAHPTTVFAALDRAFRTAVTLHGDAGLEFVQAPIRVARRIDPAPGRA